MNVYKDITMKQHLEELCNSRMNGNMTKEEVIITLQNQIDEMKSSESNKDLQNLSDTELLDEFDGMHTSIEQSNLVAEMATRFAKTIDE